MTLNGHGYPKFTMPLTMRFGIVNSLPDASLLPEGFGVTVKDDGQSPHIVVGAGSKTSGTGSFDGADGEQIEGQSLSGYPGVWSTNSVHLVSDGLGHAYNDDGGDFGGADLTIPGAKGGLNFLLNVEMITQELNEDGGNFSLPSCFVSFAGNLLAIRIRTSDNVDYFLESFMFLGGVNYPAQQDTIPMDPTEIVQLSFIALVDGTVIARIQGCKDLANRSELVSTGSPPEDNISFSIGNSVSIVNDTPIQSRVGLIALATQGNHFWQPV